MILLFTSILLVIGCTPSASRVTLTATPAPFFTPMPTETAPPLYAHFATSTSFPTFAPSLTSTPPPALAEHEWFPEPVLISVRISGGDGGDRFGDSGVPKYILYADGRLFVSQNIEIDGSDRIQVLTKKLARDEICQTLNTLDQVGFLDYDPASYRFVDDYPSIMGVGSTLIRVNAWKSNSGRFYGLHAYLIEEITDSELVGSSGHPLILPALRDTYYFVSRYPKTGFEIYKPEQLILWLYSDYGASGAADAKLWTLTNPSLAELASKGVNRLDEANRQYLILAGETAHQVYDFLGASYYNGDVVYEENADGLRNYYTVYARPLLPYELPGDYVSELTAPSSVKPDFKLTCYPSDGALPIPTPSYP